MKISIIIPVYNVERYLRECLDSVCAQTFTDWECICVDDGSTDSSLVILEEYKAKDSRFCVIRHEHTNAGTCRNVGLDLAKGEYLSFLDSDDVFAPQMLEFLLQVAETYNADIASCSQEAFHDGDSIPKLTKHLRNRDIEIFTNPSIDKDIYSKWVGWAWDKLFRRSFVVAHTLRFQEIRSTNDMRFTYSALALAKTVAHINCSLIAHRHNSRSLEATRSKSALCMIDAMKSYYSNMYSAGVFNGSSVLEHFFKIWIVNYMFWYIDTIDTTEAYQVAHDAFHDICLYFDLHSLSQDDFSRAQEKYQRLQRILNGCSPLESVRLHEKILMSEVADLSSMKAIANSQDYKLGRMVLSLPRAVKRVLKEIIG